MVRIDSHHHLWDPATDDLPWMGDAIRPTLGKRFGVDELRAVLAPHRIDGAVTVQAQLNLTEGRTLLALAAEPGSPIVGVVAWITRHHPELAPGTRGQLGGLAALCAVGFTVPLLFASQAYGPHSPEYFQTTVTLLAVSLIAAITGCTTLWLQGRDSSERTV